MANGEGGMVIRGDCGLERDEVLALVCDTALSAEDVEEDAFDSNEVFRDKAG